MTSPRQLDSSARAAARRIPIIVALVVSACVPAVPRTPSVLPSPRGASQWVVESGDVIRLRVWDQATGMTLAELMVNDAGDVLIPNAGRVNVAGSSSADVERKVIASYQGRLDPSRVEVVFLRPVAVLGGVKAPGVQLAEPSATVLSMIARAGGPIRPGGDIHAYVLRTGQATREVSTADRVADIGLRAADQLYVQDPPFVVRNEIAIRSVFQVLQFVGSTVTLFYLIRRTN